MVIEIGINHRLSKVLEKLASSKNIIDNQQVLNHWCYIHKRHI